MSARPPSTTATASPRITAAGMAPKTDNGPEAASDDCAIARAEWSVEGSSMRGGGEGLREERCGDGSLGAVRQRHDGECGVVGRVDDLHGGAGRDHAVGGRARALDGGPFHAPAGDDE